MVPECDSLEGNAESFGAKINKSEKNTSILSKKKKKRLGVVLHWKIEADLGQDRGNSGEGFCLVNCLFRVKFHQHILSWVAL